MPQLLRPVWALANKAAAPLEEKNAVSSIRAQCGLCSTCRKAPSCTYPRDYGRPVVQCEEFEGHVMSPRKATGNANLPSNSLELRSSAGEEYSCQYLGLCRICEIRDTCTSRKPEGGVWRCYEYR